MVVRAWEPERSKGSPVMGQIEVSSPHGDNIAPPETEPTSRRC